MSQYKQEQELDLKRLMPGGLVIGLILLLFLFGGSIFFTVDPGEKAIIYYPLSNGIDKENVLGQGIHFKAPWNDDIIYNVRIQESEEKMEVLSSDGLNIIVEFSFRYQADPQRIGFLHDEIGQEYLARVVKPEIRSACREVVGNYEPEELYSEKKNQIAEEIFETAKGSIEKKNIVLDKVLISDITLPIRLQEAIQKKLNQEQAAQEYDYKLKVATKEAERQIIEAEGKAKANRILSASLTTNVLKDKGIEATMELSKSSNSKVVIVGSGKDGLPLILGGQ